MRRIDTDVVVISAGLAGLAATVTVAEQGLKVISVEKNGVAGGNGNLGNGPFAVESRLQRERMLDFTTEQAYEEHMKFARYDVNGALVKHFIDKSADTIDWLEDMGVEFEGLGRHGHAMHETWHLVKPLPGTEDKNKNGGYIMINCMKKKAEELGAQILLKTEAKKLIKEDGKIVGLIAEDPEGELEIRAKAVISAAGGYGGYWRRPMGIPLFGDGLHMAAEIGAEITEGTIPPVRRDEKPVKMFGDGPAPFKFPAINSMGGQPNLVVNMYGQRFVNEYDLYVDPRGCNAFNNQPSPMAWNIFCQDIVDVYHKTGFDFIEGYGIRKMGTGPISKPTAFFDDLERSKDLPQPLVYIADTVEELAEQIHVPVENLKETVETYNRFCETGRDMDYGKRAKYLRPLTGKLYAVHSRMILGVGIPEGISVSNKLEALTPEKLPIPGLYAAGMDCCRAIWSDAYVNILPGNAMGWALNSGRMAGEYASDYVKSL